MTLQIVYMPLETLVPYAKNSRTHSDEQVSQIAASTREFGWTNPVLIDELGTIIAGHGRVMAARKLGEAQVPCIVLAGLTEAQRAAYVIADNRLALNAGWDDAMLTAELQRLTELDFDTSLLGFTGDEIAALLAPPVELTKGLTDEDAVPDVPPEPVTRLGDVWLLGAHRVMCGDSTSITDVERLMDEQRAQLLHADPPYGMGKEADGVANDNLYAEKLDAFQMEWWATFRTFLRDSASAYIWGNAPDLWRLWYRGGLGDSERLTFRNQIVWDKKHGQGIASDSHRQYPTASEHCLFYMLGEQGFNNNADNYWGGWEPIRAYLDGERRNKGWSHNDVAEFFGFHPRMAAHWFTTSQWSFLRAEQYAELQKRANGDAFKREYDDLKREFYATRAHFDNTHDNMTDVWDFARVTGADRHGHATPKPVAMMERVMRSSLPKGGLCVEPFGGSGSTLIGAEQTDRVCYTMEIQPHYCDVIVKRWQDFTGRKASLEGDGRTFDEVGQRG